jgi:radical SAM protein with 4Fe4S-binding SPASM domain
MMVRSKCQPQIMRHAHASDPDTGLLDYATRCPCGVQYCRITPEGKVTPCPYMPVEAGDLASTSFGEIWRSSRVFRELRTGDLGGRCGRCEYRAVCGGCRARAHAELGDWMAEDPACGYEPTGEAPLVLPRSVTYGARPSEARLERGRRAACAACPGSTRGRDRPDRALRGRAWHALVTEELIDEVPAMPVDFAGRSPSFSKGPSPLG